MSQTQNKVFFVLNARTNYALAAFSTIFKALAFIRSQERLCPAFEGALTTKTFVLDAYASLAKNQLFSPNAEEEL